jgi:nucleotide-binding universal stress UspA family protein
MYKRILLVSDGSVDAKGALEAALALAAQFDAELRMLVVLDLPKMPLLMAEVDAAKAQADQRAAYVISLAQRRAEEAHIAFHADVAIGSFVERTLEYMTNNPPELLVVGDGKRRPLVNIGYTGPIGQLLQSASCSVHLVKT